MGKCRSNCGLINIIMNIYTSIYMIYLMMMMMMADGGMI
jgi:hypothetical protein